MPIGSAPSCLSRDTFTGDDIDVGVGHIHIVLGASSWVGPIDEDLVVRVGGSLRKRHDVRLRLVRLVLEGPVPHDLTHLFAVGVDVGEPLATGGIVILLVGLQALGHLEVALARARAEVIILAGVVPGVAVGGTDGHGRNLPGVGRKVMGRLVVGFASSFGTIVVLAELAHVLVALVKAHLFDEELLALFADIVAAAHVVALAVQDSPGADAVWTGRGKNRNAA